MDANNFKLINNINHIVGYNAIKSIGKALRNASTQTKFCKLFHSGGDEFVLFTEINKIEPINNIHKLSVSFGIGNSYINAENALSNAKKLKDDKINILN